MKKHLSLINLIIVLVLQIISAVSCAHKNSDRAQYPAHWWAPISKEGAPDWEILPQEAGPGEVILSKRNELGILSNFAPTPFVYNNVRYASVEGFWQMMKYPENAQDPRNNPAVEWKYSRAQVQNMTAFEAKKAGTMAEENMKKLGIDWVTFEGQKMTYKSMKPAEHYKLIVEAMKAKLDQNPEVRKILRSTGNLKLKPDHHQSSDSPPEWKYYELWMKMRGEIQLN